MSNEIKYMLVFVCSVFISSISQVLLKKSANKTYQNKWKEYLNPLVILAYGMFFGATLITVIAYKFVPLSIGPILEATGYIFVVILSYFILKEKIGKRKFLGMLCIIAGICMIYFL